MDIEMMKQQLEGMLEKGKALRETEKLFIKDSGLAEEILKAQNEVGELTYEADMLKSDIAGLKAKKRDAIQSTAMALSKKMAEVLPVGHAVFKTDEDGVFIGWDMGSKAIPYDGLSGGQRATFDAAMCYALKSDLIVVEAAELDAQNLTLTLDRLASNPGQVFVNTCHAIPPESIPESFKVTEISA